MNATLRLYLQENPNSFVMLHFSPFERQFVAELQKSHLTGFEVATRGQGLTVEDAISMIDTTLLAQSLRDRGVYP
jgi:hypothetical protein